MPNESISSLKLSGKTTEVSYGLAAKWPIGYGERDLLMVPATYSYRLAAPFLGGEESPEIFKFVEGLGSHTTQNTTKMKMPGTAD